jgi:hypothetical protein
MSNFGGRVLVVDDGGGVVGREEDADADCDANARPWARVHVLSSTTGEPTVLEGVRDIVGRIAGLDVLRVIVGVVVVSTGDGSFDD